MAPMTIGFGLVCTTLAVLATCGSASAATPTATPGGVSICLPAGRTYMTLYQGRPLLRVTTHPLCAQHNIRLVTGTSEALYQEVTHVEPYWDAQLVFARPDHARCLVSVFLRDSAGRSQRIGARAFFGPGDPVGVFARQAGTTREEGGVNAVLQTVLTPATGTQTSVSIHYGTYRIAVRAGPHAVGSVVFSIAPR